MKKKKKKKKIYWQEVNRNPLVGFYKQILMPDFTHAIVLSAKKKEKKSTDVPEAITSLYSALQALYKPYQENVN